MKRFPLIAWARYIFAAGLIICLVGVLPFAWFPLQLGKLMVFSVCALVATVLFFIGGGGGGVWGKRGTLLGLAVSLLPLGYFISYTFSTDKTVGLLGYSVETDTLAFVVVGALAFIGGSFLFRRAPYMQLLLRSILGAATVALLFQLVSILFGTRVLSQLFADPSVNLVGKWNDLGLLAGLALVLLVIPLASGTLGTPLRRGFAWCAALVLVLFLALVQFPLVWGLLLAFFAALALIMYMSSGNQSRSIPWIPLAGVAVSVLFLVWGAAVQGGLVKVFPVSSLEVRPAISTTLDIVRASHGNSIERFFLGTGPGTFGYDWAMYRPVDVNQTQFWNLDFNVGYSTLATALGTVGLLGTLVWLLPLLLVLLGFVRTIRMPSVSVQENVLALSASLGALYVWLAAFLYIPSQDILLLAFALSGAAFAFAYRSDAQASDAGQEPRRIPSVVYIIISVLFVAALLAATVGIVRRYIAETYSNQGLSALGTSDVANALVFANKALSVEQTGDTLQFATLAGIAQLQTYINATSTPSAEVQQQFTQVAKTTIALGQQAVLNNPSDYRAHVLLANVYSLLASVGIQGAYESAQQTYASASAHSPTNPAIPLALARLESTQGNEKATTAALERALQLKNNYTDAILFVVQLDVAKKDIPSAINAAKAAVQSAPGVSSIWFQLGLLFYSSNNMKDAATAFEQAIVLEPQYANAKYFLGLAYATLGRNAEAIQQFTDLTVTNPDNQEVRLILSNLQAGKKPFDGAEPPVTSKPEDRTTAPIGQ